MRLTTKQLNTMLNHPDSPYIRSIALLYLRFANPRPGYPCFGYPRPGDSTALRFHGSCAHSSHAVGFRAHIISDLGQ